MVRISPSASLKTSFRDMSCVSPSSRPDISLMAEATVGAALTVTVKVSATVPPYPVPCWLPPGRSSLRRRIPWPCPYPTMPR